MPVTSGFFDSLNGDRKYSTRDISSLFDGIITDGVFGTQYDSFIVKPGTGLQVIVGTGRAWFNHTWTLNDTPMAIEIDPPNPNFQRVDVIYLEVNTTRNIRSNSIEKFVGTPAREPEVPDITARSESGEVIKGIYRYPLAYIFVYPGAVKFTPDNIQNCVGKECPLVSGSTMKVGVDEIIAQWMAEFDIKLSELQQRIDEVTQQQVATGAVSSWFGNDPELYLKKDNWEEKPGYGYKYVLQVKGMLETDNPILAVDSYSNTPEEVRDIMDAYNEIYASAPNNDSMVFWARNKPTADIKIFMQCVRK